MIDNMLSAGVYERIIDKSFIPEGEGPLVGAIVIHSNRGHIGVKKVNAKEFVAQYGLPTRDNPSMYAAMRFLRSGAELSVYRVPMDAVAATGDLEAGSEVMATFTAANPGVWGNSITVAFSDILGADPADEAFAVIVSDGGEEIERFEVSRNPDAQDGNGRNMFIEEVINERSRYIRVEDDPSVAGVYDRDATVALTGGSDATTAPTGADLVAAWEHFKNEEEVEAHILINGGWTVPNVQVAMDEVAQARSNCRAILDVPQVDSEDVDQMVAWRNLVAIDSSRSAMYGGWIRAHDPYSNREVVVPPSGDVAGIIVERFNNGEPWDAIAGLNNATIGNGAFGVTKKFQQDERDTLYVNGINPVTSIGGASAVIWGQKTLQRRASAMDRLGTVNSVLWITARCKAYLQPFVFQVNHRQNRDNINYILTTFLEGVMERGGLYDFRVDTESDNTPEVIDNNQLICNIFLKPTRYAEFIRLNVTVTPSGVDLSLM